ncbi:4a-hydroxytetrahydrobiopterin dehydratase [Streptomyces sp. NPDC087440]|uniref:4a-hydroxytetrahydrobiopterin dehydratase n=1 Tax=Streptomyces sp. NPDC087440 TaxID=3365790 RepID=UPI00382F327B
MATEPLSQKDIEDRLRELPGWAWEEDRLTRTYGFGSHLAAAAMVVHVAQIQDELDHHADIVLGYRTLGLAVNTHSAGGVVTEKDFELAQRVEEIAPGHRAD